MATVTLAEPILLADESATFPDMEAPRLVASGVTWEQFLTLDDGRHLEWIDGEVLEKPIPSELHQEIIFFLLALLRHWCEFRDAGRVLFDPYIMRIEDRRGRAPDIIFVAKENLSRIERNFLNGPADLVVEVLSPSTARVDRGGKFQEYQRGGVREYWLIDPDAQTATFYRLVNGAFQTVEPIDGAYTSDVLSGMWLRVEWLWQRPLLMNVLREWKLI